VFKQATLKDLLRAYVSGRAAWRLRGGGCMAVAAWRALLVPHAVQLQVQLHPCTIPPSMQVVLTVCKFDPLVRNADALLRTSRRVLGDRITFAAVRSTFFKQFWCVRTAVAAPLLAFSSVFVCPAVYSSNLSLWPEPPTPADLVI
jgi:hypothetical protein